MKTQDDKHKEALNASDKKLTQANQDLQSLIKSQSSADGNAQLIEWFKKEKDYQAQLEKQKQEVKRLEEQAFGYKKEAALLRLQSQSESADRQA